MTSTKNELRLAIDEIECQHYKSLEDPSLPYNLVKNAKKGWAENGWTPKANLSKHRLFLTKTKSQSRDFKTIITQPLYGDPTGPQTTLERARQMQLGEREKARKYILGACELFPDTPVLVDFTQFDLFAEEKQSLTRFTAREFERQKTSLLQA